MRGKKKSRRMGKKDQLEEGREHDVHRRRGDRKRGRNRRKNGELRNTRKIMECGNRKEKEN